MLNIDNEQGIRQAAHVLDTTQAAVQLFQIASTHQRLFLGQLGERAVFSLDFKITQTLDGSADGLVVGEHAAQPAVIDIRHPGAGRFFSNDLAGSALGADEQQLVLAGSQLFHEAQGVVEHRHGLFQVDDVNLVASTEDELAHLRVPVTGLVAEVRTGLQHIAH